MRISIAWWNTSLSPLGKSRATVKQRETALEVVEYLTKDLEVDLLALGEITTDDLAEFVSKLKLDDYEIYDGTLKTGRLQFDTGSLYRKRSFRLFNSTSLVAARGSRSLKVANRLDFLVPGADRLLHVFVSHWPSRLWCEKNSADRHVLGIRLRDAIEEIHALYETPAYTILVGDYNDEPYDPSLSEQLLAVRDRSLVRKNPELLYNPFWRLLGETFPHLPGKLRESYSGSCFHYSGIETHWRTFDQIIFSSAFLGQTDWHLNEKFTQILQLSSFTSSVLAKHEIFDHFPVLSVIEKEKHNA